MNKSDKTGIFIKLYEAAQNHDLITNPNPFLLKNISL